MTFVFVLYDASLAAATHNFSVGGGGGRFGSREGGVGCDLTFASEAKFEIEAKISFRLEAKKSLISHDSLRCETPKI
jgi:hypothetical protein